MTTDKDFKRLVRTRMAKTGESYTAARRQLRPAATSPEEERGDAGGHPEAIALRRLLDAAGGAGPGGDEPWSEPLLFGLGGGIGLSYFVFRYEAAGFTSVYVGGTINEHVLGRDLVTAAAERVGATLEATTTTSARVAERRLRAVTEAGGAALVVVDGSRLPGALTGLDHVGIDLSGMLPTPVVVADGADGAPVVRGAEADVLGWSWEELADARSAVRSAKHRMLTLAPPAAPVDLGAAVDAAVAETVAGLLAPPRPSSFGVPGLRRWASDVTDARTRRGWSRMFATPDELDGALAWIAYWVELAGGGGGNHRRLYAAFCAEAAERASRPGLADAAAAYEALADRWTALAVEVVDADPADGPGVLERLGAGLDELADAEARAAEGLRDSASSD